MNLKLDFYKLSNIGPTRNSTFSKNRALRIDHICAENVPIDFSLIQFQQENNIMVGIQKEFLFLCC